MYPENSFKNLYIQVIFAGTEPKKPHQDLVFGHNDLMAAKASRMFLELESHPLENGLTDEWMVEYQLLLIDEVAKWSAESEYLNVAVFTTGSWEAMFKKDILKDLVLMLYAMVLVTMYSIVVLGGCSPIHMRSSLAIFGIICVIVATTSGYGLSFLCGLLVSEMHNVLPFMLLGIGVDNMFVIVSCVDQSPADLPIDERFRIGLVHAGPSITITSVTDAIAFFLASWTALAPLESFCLFAGLCLITLYIAMLSLFPCWFIWDLQRQKARKGDCHGACFCKEDSKIFCEAKFLSKA